MKSPALAAALAAALIGAAAPGAQAQTAPGLQPDAMFAATTVALAASGEVKAAPDMATVSLGVQTQATTAAQAMSDNARRMAEVVAAIRRGGVEAKDIQTSGLNLAPQWAYEQNQPPRLTGYQASNQVTVTVNDLARLGPVLDAVVGAGANQVNGVSFGLKDPQAAQDQARQKAVQALQARARLYADATGYRVGRLVNLSETGGVFPEPPRPLARMTAAVAMAPTPVEAGELDVRVDITGLYELTK
jgi:uncharacterized protein YggE